MRRASSTRSALRHLLLFLPFPLATACLSPIHRAEWTVVNTPNFEIMSTLSSEDTVTLAGDLERFRALVFAVTTAPRRPAPIPTRIFAFKRAGEFAPFNPIRRAAGFFTSSPRANYVGLVDHSSKLDARSIVFHEYVHFILRNATPIAYPIWYDEGFAEVLSTVQAYEDQLIVGAIPKVRMPSFRYGKWIPMRRIIAATSYSDVPQNQVHMLYAEAWALAHYVTLDRAGEGSIDEYFNLVESGMETSQAYERAFSEPIEKSDDNIRRRLREGDWRLLGIPLENLQFDRTKPTTRKPTESEVATQLGSLQLANNAVREAQVLLQAALEADSTNARAHAGMGNALKLQSRFGGAGPHFRRAVELDPTDPLNHLDLAEYLHELALKESRGAEHDRLLSEAREAYEAARELDPSAPEVQLMIGRTYLAPGEDAHQSVRFIAKAFVDLPSDDTVIHSLAEAYIATGREVNARDVLRRSVAHLQDGSLDMNLEREIESIRARRVKAAKEYQNPTKP